MNNRLLAAAVFGVALLVGCASQQPAVQPSASSTTFPPTQYVDLLEAPPTRPFQEIGVIDVPGDPGSARAQVLAQIRARAQQMGADAVILQDRSRAAPTTPRLNPTTGMYETTGGQLIPSFHGIAIKYR